MQRTNHQHQSQTDTKQKKSREKTGAPSGHEGNSKSMQYIRIHLIAAFEGALKESAGFKGANIL